MRATFFLLALLVTAATARAQNFPQIPESQRVLSLLEVKNYWVNRLPRPTEPGRLDRGYKTLIVEYHQRVGERHRLIQAIQAGTYDRLAKVVMLRHNIQAFRLKGDDASAAELAAELAAIEAVVLREEQKRADADRLERLIAATERLVAAIENNGGNIPPEAQPMVDEIIPFERDRDGNRDIITHLRDEIALYRQPIIVHQRHHHTPGVSRHITSNRGTTGHGTTVQVRPSISPSQGTSHRSKTGTSTSQPQVRTVTPRQPQVRQQPVRQQPVRQQPVRPVPAPRQPQVRPAR